MSSSPLLSRRSFLKIGAFAAATVAAPQLLTGAAPERSLSLYNLHTTEQLKLVYWSEGAYVPESLTAINRLLRDHRTGAIHDIEPKLLDLLCRVRTELDTTE